jgi:hypothetical protein
MTFEPHETSNLVLGLRILLCLLLPIGMILLIRYITTPVTPPSCKTSPARIPDFFELHKLRNPALKYCHNHLTNLPKGRIALIVGQSQCQLCKNKRY